MRKIVFFILLTITMTSCASNKCKICGSWTSTTFIESTQKNVTDELVFAEDGKFTGAIFINGDSLVQRWEGKYEIDNKNNRLKLIYPETTLIHTIVDIGIDTLKLINPQGFNVSMRRK